MGEYFAFTNEMRDREKLVAGDALMPTETATTVRVRDGKTVTTDGPFAETKEQLGGYYLLDCADLDEAIALYHTGRTRLLARLKALGVEPLPKRQAVANFIGKLS